MKWQSVFLSKRPTNQNRNFSQNLNNDELTLTLGGTDAASFNLSAENVLTFKEAPDYETKISYFLNLSATDGVDTTTKEITVDINNLNDNPPIFTTGNVSIDENIKDITTITASDADGDSLVFSLKDNTNDIIDSNFILNIDFRKHFMVVKCSDPSRHFSFRILLSY